MKTKAFSGWNRARRRRRLQADFDWVQAAAADGPDAWLTPYVRCRADEIVTKAAQFSANGLAMRNWLAAVSVFNLISGFCDHFSKFRRTAPKSFYWSEIQNWLANYVRFRCRKSIILSRRRTLMKHKVVARLCETAPYCVNSWQRMHGGSFGCGVKVLALHPGGLHWW